MNSGLFGLFLESPISRVRPPHAQRFQHAEIAPEDFYNSSRRSSSSQPLPASSSSSLLLPDAPLKQQQHFMRYYAKQQQAFDAALPTERVFVEEIASADPSAASSQPTDTTAATRRFFCATTERLWALHNAAAAFPEQRHLYEVIAEGEPCKLYADCEFSVPHNPHADGDAVSRAVRELLRGRLGRRAETAGPIVELDSTTPEKWSRHLVFCGAAFEDNAAMGDYVRSVVSAAMDDAESPLAVRSSRGTRQSVVDLAVYSRNRHFRMLGSCKFGRRAVLEPTEETRALFGSERDLFLASLVCNVSPLVSFVRPLQDAAAASSSAAPHRPVQQQRPTEDRPVSSPFPALDCYVAGVVSKMGNASGGFIRSSKYFSTTRLVVYTIGGNRWCERIGRQHRSNHVMIVVNLQAGVYYQKCLDPDCSNFRGTEHPIPRAVLDTTEEEEKLPSF